MTLLVNLLILFFFSNFVRRGKLRLVTKRGSSSPGSEVWAARFRVKARCLVNLSR